MLAALCGGAPGAFPGRLLLGLFLAGAAGSTMHCVPMCGSFVLGQVADRMARLPAARFCEWHRVRAGALLPYHLGRLTTYASLGAIAGLGGAGLARLPSLGFISAAFLLLAGGFFLLHAIPSARRILPGLDRVPSRWSHAIARLAKHLRSHGYTLGVALGFLPCGLLYGAMAAAAASGSAVAGAIAMLTFGAGTAPALVAVGIAGQSAGRHWRRGVTRAAPAIMLLNAVLLSALALHEFFITNT